MICKYQIGNEPIYRFEMPMIASNMYIIMHGDQALLIDPHGNADAVHLLKKHDVKQLLIILTHEHYDHISGVNYFRKEWRCRVIGSRSCQESVKEPAKNLAAYFMAMFITRSGEERQEIQKQIEQDYHCEVDEGFEQTWRFEFASFQVVLCETPGHSPGSICICINDRYLFTGDSLIPGEKAITRLPGGNRELYQKITVPYLQSFDPETIIFPGHGAEEYLRNIALPFCKTL